MPWRNREKDRCNRQLSQTTLCLRRHAWQPGQWQRHCRNHMLMSSAAAVSRIWIILSSQNPAEDVNAGVPLLTQDMGLIAVYGRRCLEGSIFHERRWVSQVPILLGEQVTLKHQCKSVTDAQYWGFCMWFWLIADADTQMCTHFSTYLQRTSSSDIIASEKKRQWCARGAILVLKNSRQMQMRLKKGVSTWGEISIPSGTLVFSRNKNI